MSLSSTLLLATGSFVQAAGTAGIAVNATGDAHIYEILDAAGTAPIGVSATATANVYSIYAAAGTATIDVSATGDPMVTLAAAGTGEINVTAGAAELQVVGARLMAKCYVSQIPESAGDNVYAPVQHITMRRGDNLILYLRFRDLRDNVYPLTTAGNLASIWFTVKARYSEPDSGALVQRTVGDGIYVTDGPTGEAQVVLTHAETSILGAREYDYVWDVQIKRDLYGSESIISTANEGTMTVNPDVTIDVATHVEVSS
jgi:hypothetical protein